MSDKIAVMTSRVFSLTFLFSVLVIVGGCNVEQGSGVAKIVHYDLAEFDSIDMRGTGEMLVEVGNEQAVALQFDDNLIDMVTVEVVDGVLVVDSQGTYSSSIGKKILVSIPQVKSATLSGVGEMEITGIEQESLNLSISGTSEMTVSGTVGKVVADVSGTGELEAQKLVAKEVIVSVAGTADATVFATESVNATTSGVGDIEVYGNPQDRKESEGGVGEVTFK